MKKSLLLLLIVVMLFSAVSAISAADKPLAGVIWYNFADTFIQNARQSLLNVAKADGTIEITDADSNNETERRGRGNPRNSQVSSGLPSAVQRRNGLGFQCL